MSDEIEAVTESAKAVQEVAKTTGKVAEMAQAGGAYLARMLGTVPEDVVGLLGGDYLRQVRIRNWHSIGEKTFQQLKNRGVEEPVPLEIKHVAPLLEAASHESDETLQDMWARLLANALDPRTDVSLQRILIDTLREFEPLDALVLSAAGPPLKHLHDVATDLRRRGTEVQVSAQRLDRLGCTVGYATAHVELAPLGSELMRACDPEPDRT